MKRKYNPFDVDLDHPVDQFIFCLELSVVLTFLIALAVFGL
jgi:hypothetical protein